MRVRNAPGGTTTGDPENFGFVSATLVKQRMGGGKAALVTFDLTPEVIESIKAGDTLAAIDQQPYLQGFLPAILARQYLEAGLMPGRDNLTGPGVVNAGNLDQVLDATKQGRRSCCGIRKGLLRVGPVDQPVIATDAAAKSSPPPLEQIFSLGA